MNDTSDMEEGQGFLSEAAIKIAAANLREDEPDIKTTLERLSAEGHSLTDARELVARALAVESHSMFKEGKPFDRGRLQRNLEALPEVPKK